MLVTITNTALVQVIQACVWGFYLWVAVAATSARLHLPGKKLAVLYDLLLVFCLLIDAVVLRVTFAT